MASSSSQRQWSSSDVIRPTLDDKLGVQRSLQEAAEDIKVKLHSKDCFVKATVSDPPELMRQQALSTCNSPPSDWRDQQKPSVLREGQCFFYRSYTGLTRTLNLDPFATVAEVETAIENKEGEALLEGCLKSNGKALTKKHLDLNDYHVKPGSTFDLPSRLCGGGSSDDDARANPNPSRPTPSSPTERPTRRGLVAHDPAVVPRTTTPGPRELRHIDHLTSSPAPHPNGGGNDDDARPERGPSRSATQNSAQPDNALVSTSTGEASLLPEGDPLESLRAQQNIATPHGGQDSTGVAQEPEPEPAPESEMDTTRGSETTHADPHDLMFSLQERGDSTSLSKPNLSISTRKISPVKRAVSLKWLQRFVTKHSGMCYSFTRLDYVDVADGGGNQHGIDIAAENLGAHRAARRAAERAGSGKPVVVRYVDIPFEDMTTADVMEAIIRPMCRKHHKSYAEAVIMLDAVGFIGDPTYFVSTFPNSFVTGVCCLMLPSLALHFRLHSHGSSCS